MNLDEKLKKIQEGLDELGKKYGYGSPPEYLIETASTTEGHPQERDYHFSCRVAEERSLNITVAVHEKAITVLSSEISPEQFAGFEQVEEALDDVEEFLQAMMEVTDSDI